MGWSALTLVTDSDLGMLEPEATNGHWKTTTWPNQRAEAKRDLKIRLETDYANIPNVADKIKDTHKPDAVWGYTGSSYTDWTAEAESSDEDDRHSFRRRSARMPIQRSGIWCSATRSCAGIPTDWCSMSRRAYRRTK